MNDAIDNKTKCLMYALNLTNSNHKSQIQHILNQLNQFKIESTIDANSNANASSNTNVSANSNPNANSNQAINTDIKMENTQIEQNDQQRMQTTMKSRIEKSIETKMKKIQSHLDSKLNQMMHLIQPRIKIVESQNSKNSNLNSIILLILRQYKDHILSKNAATSNS